MTTSAPAAQAQTGRHQRSVKNYLIDKRFQLKYTGMIISVAVVISAILGTFLISTNSRLVEQSQRVVDESKKVSDVVKMNIKDNYGDNPELAQAFNAAASETDQKIIEQQTALVHQQNVMFSSLVIGLGVMVLLIGLLGIFFTHKVAGPIYKMKMLLRQVGEGKLTFNNGRLRKGDELQEFFETFSTMVDKLKDRQRRECELLDAAIDKAKDSGASEDAVKNIIIVRDEMRAALEK
jgi:flagellar biosynthesis/type III secretory pathway M-ring protein FliF/YscJ